MGPSVEGAGVACSVAAGAVVSGGAWARWVVWWVMRVLCTPCSRRRGGEPSEAAQLLGGGQEEIERQHMD